MKKTVLFLTLVFLLIVSGTVFASPLTGTNDDGDNYSINSLVVTFRQIDFHNATTNTWITVFAGNRQVDVTTGVGTLISGANLLPGTYDKMFFYQNTSMNYSGTVTHSGTVYNSGAVNLTIAPDSVYNPSDPDAIGGSTQLLNHQRGVSNGLFGSDVIMSPFTIVAGQSKNIVISLNTAMTYDSSGGSLADMYSLSHTTMTASVN